MMVSKLMLTGVGICALLSSSCGTNKKLQAANNEISQLQSQNNELSKRAGELESRNKALMTEYSNYKEDCQEAEAQLKVVRDVLLEEEKNLQKLKEKIDGALANFKDKGVDVYYKSGLLFVSLADDLLYKSGSSSLGTEGKNALSSLASVLNDYPKLRVIVLGNTDDVQFKKGSDNWSLSTERANGVVRILRDQYHVDPFRLTAAGKGQYNPVADNTTAEGRAKNRRTDIILNPDLDRLWASVQREGK